MSFCSANLEFPICSMGRFLQSFLGLWRPTGHLDGLSRLAYRQAYTEIPELGGSAAIFDQDANNLPEVQRGLIASQRGTVMTAQYQECRIRHFHQTLDHYLNREV